MLLKSDYCGLSFSTIIQKMFETNSDFLSARKSQFLFFKSFRLVLKKNSFWQGDWSSVCYSSRFWDFLDFSSFPKILNLKSFYKYTLFITNNRASFHLWWKGNLVKHQKVPQYYFHDCLKNSILLFVLLSTPPIVIFRLEFSSSF